MKDIEMQDYKKLKQVFDTIKSLIPNAPIKLNLKTDSNTDTEIFIRKGLSIFSFRVSIDGTYFDRWSRGDKRNFKNDRDLIDYIISIIK